MKKSRIAKLNVVFLIVFLLLALAAFMAGRPDLRYRISEALRSEKEEVLPKKIKIKDLREYTYSDLKSGAGRYKF